MTLKTYNIKYRQPGQWFWRKVRGIVGDGIDYEGRFRYFQTNTDKIRFVGLDAELEYPPERQKAIDADIAREAGHATQRA